MTKAYDKPALSLLVKLGSIAVLAEELLPPKWNPFDREAIKTLLDDPEVKEWISQMNVLAMLPVKR